MSEQQVETQEQPEGIFISNEQAKAVNILLAAVNVAQNKGAFNFADSAAVFEAVKTFAPPAPPAEEVAEEVGSD